MPSATANVTTASAIEGWTIEQHLGVVAAHVVAGVGLVSEFFAGFSDIFGGRSESYRRQLAGLYEEAVTELLEKARYKGGNWLIGLRIDMDEVSGKGTQMFMITALATAVRARPDRADGRAESLEARSLTKVQADTARKRLDLLEAAARRTLELTDTTWAFLVQERVHELAPYVLDWLAQQREGAFATQFIPTSPEQVPPLLQRTLAFFATIPRAAAVQALYAAIEDGGSHAEGALDVIRRNSLLDLRATRDALRSSAPDHRRSALQTLRASQSQYVWSDLDILAELESLIPSLFQRRSQIVRGKGLLGGDKEQWLCPCEHKNGMDDSACRKCGRDQYGFSEGELKPQAAVGVVRRLREALHSAMSTSDELE